MTIYKYPVPFRSNLILELPVSAELLTVQMQGDNPVVWVKLRQLSPEAMVERKFKWYATGESFPEIREQYIGTVQTPNGLVFHLFEVL